MIKVVFVLVVLLLSVIFAYLALSNKKDSSKESPQPKSTKTQEQEDEDISSTATSRPIETEPPEEEDPGTCETTGDWAMSGECQADGTAIYTQTYKESKPGACPSTEKARTKPCCYQKGDWKDITGCDEGGLKTQEQTTVNCASSFKTRREHCKYIGPWKKVSGCALSGDDGRYYELYNRAVVKGTEPTSKKVLCNPVNCEGKWEHDRYWYGPCKCKLFNPNCSQKRIHKNEYGKYVVTQNASNGGNECPHKNGDTRLIGVTIIPC